MKAIDRSFYTVMSVVMLMLLCMTSSAQKLDQSFFKDTNSFLKKHVSQRSVDYAAAKMDKSLTALISRIATTDLTDASAYQKQAFYINAYNLHVINQVSLSYPIGSVMDKGGFFDKMRIEVAGESLTLNELEKDKLLKKYMDARFHFVLVCGAVGCPPITDFAYTPDRLEQQLDQQARNALNDAGFIKVVDGKTQLSEIFKWYADDFGGSKDNVIKYINRFRNAKIASSSKVSYYNYDWKLNDKGSYTGSVNTGFINSNEARYIVSSTIPKGSYEFKLFNNLYSQQTGTNGQLEDRSSFFTTSLSAMYGLTPRFNIGLNTRFRKVRNNGLPSSPFSVFGSDDEGSSRSGLTAIGPQIRYAPVPRWQNFSIQSSFVFPIGTDLAGSDTQPYIDWTGATWNTQFFNDFSIGSKFSLFTEFDILLEDIGSNDAGHVNRFSTPVTIIFSYVPTTKLTFYTIGGYSPYWQSEFDYFTQFGLGSKYQFTPSVELELLYTDFANKFLNDNGGKAETINVGFRLNI